MEQRTTGPGKSAAGGVALYSFLFYSRTLLLYLDSRFPVKRQCGERQIIVTAFEVLLHTAWLRMVDLARR